MPPGGGASGEGDRGEGCKQCGEEALGEMQFHEKRRAEAGGEAEE